MLCFISIFILSLLMSISSKEIKCGDYVCNLKHGVCVEENLNMICVCLDRYETFPLDNPEKCNYKKKSKVKALLLELFITYGSGHFYTENYKLAIPKFLFWVFTYYAFIVLKAIHKGNENNKRFEKILKFCAIITLILMVIWQMIDLFLFGLNIYSDGNGVELI